MTEPSTLPATPPPFVPAPPPPPPGPVSFPITWILANATYPIQYRAITEVARADRPITDAFAALPYAHRPALRLAIQQAPDGSWNGSMLTLPSNRAEHFEGVGTIPAVRRLLEYGWDRESPPLLNARRLLFRLLAEDEDPAYAFELAPRGKSDPEQVHHARMLLREAAAATLAQAGYDGDPRLRGAARRIIDRTADFLRSPEAEKPFVRIGNKHVLAPEAAPPSVYVLTMLAFMPLFRSEHHQQVDLLYEYIARPQPRQTPAVAIGKRIVQQPHLILGDMLPNRNAADADVPWALAWLELMARLNFLRRNEGWAKLFDRFLEDRDAQGVWHPHKGMAAARSANPLTWPTYPLEEALLGEERWTDVTFRLGLIARLSGRTIELV